MKQDIEHYLDTLTQCDMFKGIGGDRLLPLLDTLRARVTTYARGETIYRYGDEVREAALVLEGTVMVESSDAEGEDTNLNLLRKGDEFGTFVVLSGSMRSLMDVYAGTRCAILTFDVRALGISRDKRPEEWQLVDNILTGLASKCMDLYRKVQIYGMKRIRSRLRLYLLSLPAEEDEVVLPMNRTALAAYLGVDRTALAREIGRMQDEGLIAVNKRRVRLLNADFFSPLSRP